MKVTDKEKLKSQYLEKQAERYTRIRKGEEEPDNHINSYESIEFYTDWFLESRELFSKYFDENNTTFKEFTEFKSGGNGHVLSSKFSQTYSLFKILIRNLENGATKPTMKKIKKSMKNRAFIVHGHNNELKLEVARFIETDFGKKAVILHERPNRGREILGKFEDEADVDFAIAIWSKDDLGQLNKEGEKLRPRARQNVIFETGYFIGKLGRENVIVILEDGIEAPSDYSGLMYISAADWKYKLSKEIKEIYKSEE